LAKFIAISLLLVCVFSVKAQTETDTIKPHSPHKAAVLSAILPGAGQVYNKKYWKVPIVYAAIGVTGFYAYDNLTIYRGLRDEYLARLNGKPFTITEICSIRNPEGCTTQTIVENIDYYRRQRDIFIIATIAVYALQIVDAAVDAHLFNFDVSDDLSLHWQPSALYVQNTPAFGATLTLKLK
jgi:hypothetical protein